MAAVELTQDGNVWLLRIANHDRDNTFTLDALGDWHAALDNVEASTGDRALLIWSDHPKTFCNGIDLEWMMKQPAEEMRRFVYRLDSLFLRLALFPMPTLVSINGNAYGGGAILASAADFRFMRADRGRFCYPEVKIRMAFTPAMLETIRLLPNPRALNRLALTSDAIGGTEAQALGVVDEIHATDALHPAALARTRELATKHRPTYTEIKRMLRADLVRFVAARAPAPE